tara:strand:+ start:1471 stop:1836 length:366 start_codon:yes stop_codon:yes gene_type:complete
MKGEALLQSNIIKYLSLKYPKIRYCASLGGQYQRYHSQRTKAKATGYVKGFPDLQITEARGGFFGLFLEIKDKGYPTLEQKEWIEALTKRGYKAEVCKGLMECISTIDNYLEDSITQACTC